MGEGLSISVQDGKERFIPGESVSGTLRWDLMRPPENLALRLFWYTEGKGDQDAEIVAEERYDVTTASGDRSFRFTLPEGPYSFSGSLVSLSWAIEAVASQPDSMSRVGIVVGPDGREILLPGHASEG